MSNQCITWACVGFWSLLAAINPWAATGAAFGCCFFLGLPGATTHWQRIKLSIFSFGLGYAGGVFWFGEGPPYSSKAMLISAALAALAAVIFTAFYAVITNNGPLPAWLENILDRIPFLKRGS